MANPNSLIITDGLVSSVAATSVKGQLTCNTTTWSSVADGFFLQATLDGDPSQSVSATLMVDLAIGCVFGGDEKRYTYFRVWVTGPSGYNKYALAGENRQAQYMRTPNLIRGFFQLTAAGGSSFTFTPQWRVSSDTSTIVDIPDVDQDQSIITNFFSIWAVSSQSGIVQGDGANG